jgi:HD superfamily phosphohydrolase
MAISWSLFISAQVVVDALTQLLCPAIYIQVRSDLEIRCPIHGFIKLNEWERDIVDHPVFQRLRRIRQLAWTEAVYPGAAHTRFEHSLGVMHSATLMFDAIVNKADCREILEHELNFNTSGIEKDRQVVRLAALLHDVGHAPFSHAAEALMPRNAHTNKPFRHEDYSAAAVRLLMTDVIDRHPQSENFGITAAQVADFIERKSTLGRQIFWHELLSGQFDADRADYLLRDSHHLGVAYGKYDLHRLIATITIALDDDTPRIAVERGGLHAAEALILARYLMFTQVYFQHTRRIFDHHLEEAMRTMLERPDPRELISTSQFPPPDGTDNLHKFLDWDDWRVYSELSNCRGGPHGEILKSRKHFSRVFETPEVPATKDMEDLERVVATLGNDVRWIDKATNSWYKSLDKDIRIRQPLGRQSVPLSECSAVVKNMRSINQFRVYVSREDKQKAEQALQKLFEES